MKADAKEETMMFKQFLILVQVYIRKICTEKK